MEDSRMTEPSRRIQGRLLYAQSGGVTAVINATAAGVIEAARARGVSVYAARNGILGALREELIDTSKETKGAMTALRHTPGGAFGSCRYKLKSLEANRAEYERLIEVFRAHDIRWFLYHGGNDSADTALKISQLGKAMDYDIRCIGVPKTVDNDLAVTDCCPGFGSVAKYTAISTLEASLDVASMAETSTKVFILEVMGRHAGWIAAASGLAGDGKDGAPHIILFPENAFDEATFLAKVKATVERVGWCTVVASEGVRNQAGQFLAEAGTRDAFGHAQLGGAAPVVANMVKDALGYKFHWAVADYLQRAARHIASKTDVKQAYELGKAAVQLALKGHNAIMPTIERISDTPYKYKIGVAQLSDVANVEKFMPRDFITEDGFGITAACRQYLLPLIQGEDYPLYRNGMPVYATMKNVAVPRKLAEFALK
jgi:6-phosphofructokinase 1